MKKYVNGKAVEMTAEEIAEIQKHSAITNSQNKYLPLSAEEVNNIIISAQINTLPIDDDTSLRMINYYPEWAVNTSYTIGYKVRYGGKLYKAIQAHTSQADWKPDAVASLWAQINEVYAGTLEEPVLYSGNMALEKGKYYTQEYTIYLCTRDTVNPVYHNLSELIGLYVEVV